jgi:hypothetical protein
MSDHGDLPLEPVPHEQLRVGDAERHQAATALGDHFATGRLDQAEFDERVQAAYAARTRLDLQRLFLDLPEPAPFRVASAPVPRPQPGYQPRSRRFPVFLPLFPLLFVALIVVSIVTRVPVFPPFLLLFWVMWFGFGRRAWRGPRGYAGTRSW